MMAQGTAAQALAPSGALRFYNAVIPRYLQGVLVPESHAWARFNANDDVTAEEVYWPAVPASALTEALGLQALLAKPGVTASFRAKMRADAQQLPIHVCIHHTEHFAWNRPFEVFVSADVGEHLFAPSLDGSTVYFVNDPPVPPAPPVRH
jgi:hypothetical protein